MCGVGVEEASGTFEQVHKRGEDGLEWHEMHTAVKCSFTLGSLNVRNST